ncbi:hypothetical protein KIPB_009805, partial [Kipferlia bialata]|eukprot:g9805.t1
MGSGVSTAPEGIQDSILPIRPDNIPDLGQPTQDAQMWSGSDEAEAADEGEPGDTMQYARGDMIGKGAFGIVYKALNLASGAFIAVKEIDVMPRGGNADNITREIRTLQAISHHPNVVRYL